MKEIELREMSLEDYETIKDILIEEFDEFWKPEILKSELESENKNYIVAITNGEIIGFAGILINKPEAEIMNIVTKKKYRKNGVGTKLLKELIGFSEKNNINKIFLEVNEKNNIARKLYKKAGFEEVGRRKKYYNNDNDAIIMSKKLNIL